MNTTERLEPISNQDFLALGVNDVAYIKPVTMGGQAVFAVHAADGQQIAVMANRELAEAAIRRNEMEPLSIH